MVSVSYQGEPGAFSETAARRILGSEISLQPCPTFEDMFDRLAKREVDCCVAPIENSLAGSIHRNYDLLLESKFTVAGETNLRIVHNLLAGKGATVAGLRRVYSHPVALAQCANFLRSQAHVESVPAHDTAGAVRLVIERGRVDEAAIASSDAAGIYGAQILAAGIEDNPQNFTRFLLIVPPENCSSIPLRDAPRRWKTSLVFRLPNKPGSLFKAIGAFAMFDIDLAKIESRPVAGRPWEYAFYLDVIGRQDEPALARAIANLSEMAEMLHVLGSYPTRW
jgi:prephenate dehydratase